MINVIIPILVLIGIVVIKKIPVIGGKVHWALLISGAVALLTAGIFSPMAWVNAYIDGLNRLSWVILIAIFGSIYAETQIAMGTMDVVLGASRSAFGRSPKGLYVAGMITLILFGSLLGEGLSAACVVGVLIIPPLIDLGMEPEQVSASLVLGGLLGSLCPPMTNAIVLASSLCGANYDEVLKWSFLTVPFCCIVIVAFYAIRWIKIKSLPEHLIPKEKAGTILKQGIAKLIPMLTLVVIMILAYGPWNSKVNTNVITYVWGWLQKLVANIPFVNGLGNMIVLSLLTVTIIACCFKSTREYGIKNVIVNGWKKYLPCGAVHLCCALMLGGFYAAGLIDTISEWASTLNTHALKLGGAGAMGLMGMITGSQSTTQNVVLSFFGPALVATGMTPESAALAGAHIAMGSQAFPPTDLCTIVVAPLVAGVIGKKCDYVKSMMKSLPGFLFLYGFGILLLFFSFA
ncbi:MAG: TRAP transporter large permease subunit [Candidatus Metalachnospira sp.]|nr:TRAP transporter large permease subunit [Candidatus Metalachnospira sp.]